LLCPQECQTATKDNARRPVSRVLSRARYPVKDRPLGGSHSSNPCVAARFKQPTRTSRDETSLPNHGREAPIWPCSGWGLPCERCCQRPGALLPHPFTLTPDRVRGGLLSVALSLGFPRAGVTRHPCFVEPGLSSYIPKDNAAAQPPGEPYLASPRSRSKSNWNRIARTWPSICPSIFSGRQRRWNASTALCPSVTS